MNQYISEAQTLAIATEFASADDPVCRAILESGVEVPAEFVDMFAARTDPRRCKRVRLRSATDMEQHMEKLDKARMWFLTHIDVSASLTHRL